MSLDTRENRILREARERQENQPAPLNEPFPFVRTPFDPFYFGLEDEPPAAVES